MKRIVTIQDLSCFGKCSLTVALPLISAMGVECCAVPTAVLSTHTQFSGFTFCDLTDELTPIAEHWQAQELSFDAVYTGYLGSERQIGIVLDYFRAFGAGALKAVDPVMGDNGRLYTGFTQEFALQMAKLCGNADLIMPNLTEAAAMLSLPYRAEPSEAEVQELLKRLTGLGARTALLTGVRMSENEIGVMSYDAEKDSFEAYFHPRVNASYHGTGDIFASVLSAALLRGLKQPDAVRLAADYTAACIRRTAETPNGIGYGVYFEAEIPELLRRLEAAGAEPV